MTHNDLIENVVEQAKLHREIGYLEGRADAYRGMALKRVGELSSLEDELGDILDLLAPPF